MSDAETIARLRTILSDIAPDLDVSTVGPDDDLRNDIGLDSMDFLNFVIAAHKQLGVEVPEADYAQVSTLNGLAAYLLAHMSETVARSGLTASCRKEKMSHGTTTTHSCPPGWVRPIRTSVAPGCGAGPKI